MQGKQAVNVKPTKQSTNAARQSKSKAKRSHRSKLIGTVTTAIANEVHTMIKFIVQFALLAVFLFVGINFALLPLLATKAPALAAHLFAPDFKMCAGLSGGVMIVKLFFGKA